MFYEFAGWNVDELEAMARQQKCQFSAYVSEVVRGQLVDFIGEEFRHGVPSHLRKARIQLSLNVCDCSDILKLRTTAVNVTLHLRRLSVYKTNSEMQKFLDNTPSRIVSDD